MSFVGRVGNGGSRVGRSVEDVFKNRNAGGGPVKRRKKKKKAKKKKKQLYPEDGNIDILKAPYYDPRELHVCIFKQQKDGQYIFPQDPRSKYMTKVEKCHYGSYCIVCHRIKKQLQVGDVFRDCINPAEKLLITAMDGYISDENNKMIIQERVDIIEDDLLSKRNVSRWEKLTKSLLDLYDCKRTRINSTYLFIVGSECKFLHNGFRNGVITSINYIEWCPEGSNKVYIKEVDTVVIEETKDGKVLDIHKVKHNKVFPVYNIFNKNTNNNNTSISLLGNSLKSLSLQPNKPSPPPPVPSAILGIASKMSNLSIDTINKPVSPVGRSMVLDVFNDNFALESPGSTPINTPTDIGRRYNKLNIQIRNKINDIKEQYPENMDNDHNTLLVPVNYPPKSVPLVPVWIEGPNGTKILIDKQDIWTQRWTNYTKWRNINQKIKSILYPLQKTNSKDQELYKFLVNEIKEGNNNKDSNDYDMVDIVRKLIINKDGVRLEKIKKVWERDIIYNKGTKTNNSRKRAMWNMDNDTINAVTRNAKFLCKDHTWEKYWTVADMPSKKVKV